MAYKIIQWATGRAGLDAVRGMAQRRDMQLVGAWVHSEDKDGRDLGELCGVAPLGVRATRDKDAVLALDADCVCYMAGRSWVTDPQSTLDELVRILRSGKNVVNTTYPALLNPTGVSQEAYDALQEACLAGGVSFYTSGIDPGHGSFGLAMAALTTSRDVRSIHTYEFGNYGDYVDEHQSVAFFGFGQPDIDKCVMLQPGVPASMFASSIQLFARALDVELDDIAEGRDVILADEAFDTGACHIPKGTISGMRFRVMGMHRGRPLVTIEHVTRLRDEDFTEFGFVGSGYRVDVSGQPDTRLDVHYDSSEGDHTRGAWMATAMVAVNAIPQVCEAPPGVLTYLDLRPHPSTNVVA